MNDIDTLFHDTTSKGVDEFRPRRAHVLSNHDVRDARERGKRDTQRVCNLCVELVGHRATNVIRLDDCIELRASWDIGRGHDSLAGYRSTSTSFANDHSSGATEGNTIVVALGSGGEADEDVIAGYLIGTNLRNTKISTTPKSVQKYAK